MTGYKFDNIWISIIFINFYRYEAKSPIQQLRQLLFNKVLLFLFSTPVGNTYTSPNVTYSTQNVSYNSNLGGVVGGTGYGTTTATNALSGAAARIATTGAGYATTNVVTGPAKVNFGYTGSASAYNTGSTGLVVGQPGYNTNITNSYGGPTTSTYSAPIGGINKFIKVVTQ